MPDIQWEKRCLVWHSAFSVNLQTLVCLSNYKRRGTANQKPQQQAEEKPGELLQADGGRLFSWLCVDWESDKQSGRVVCLKSHTNRVQRENIYKAVWSFFPPFLSCIPLLSNRQTHLVDQNNSSAKSSQNPVFCISHSKALGMITKKLGVEY